MKTMVINFSGNVGKSTIARYLLAPRLSDCKIFNVESINENEHDEKQIRGNALGAILDEMMLHDNAILDIGSSNAETVVSLLSSYSDAHEDFDLFILPVIAKPKVIADTIATVSALNAIGVPAEKLIIVLNQIEVDTDISVEFNKLDGFNNVSLSYDPALAIPMHDFFTRIAGTGFDFLEVLHDETNYSKLAKETEKDDPALKDYILRLALKRLATSLNKKFDELFRIIEKKVAENV